VLWNVDSVQQRSETLPDPDSEHGSGAGVEPYKKNHKKSSFDNDDILKNHYLIITGMTLKYIYCI
jgi:hypothetical protein